MYHDSNFVFDIATNNLIFNHRALSNFCFLHHWPAEISNDQFHDVTSADPTDSDPILPVTIYNISKCHSDEIREQFYHLK